MFYRLIQLFIIACSIIHFTQSTYIFNLTNPDKILCYSCKGNHCEDISKAKEHILACNRQTQLCWAGFVNQKPYRTCANRYCTPSAISLDDDVRSELCCRSNLCNTATLSWAAAYDESVKSSSQSLKNTMTTSAASSTDSSTTVKTLIKEKMTQEPQVYVVNEIVNEAKQSPSDEDHSNDYQSAVPSRKIDAKYSDPLRFDINWERLPYNTDFGTRMVSMSKLVILLLPLLLVFLF